MPILKYTVFINKIKFYGCGANIYESALIQENGIYILYYTYALKQFFMKNELFLINIEAGIYNTHQFVTSSVNFRHNLRYFGFVKSDDMVVTYISGRELVIKDDGKLKKLKKVNVSIKDTTVRVIFGGLNSYRYLDSQNVIHTLVFNSFILKHHKVVYRCLYSFLKLNEQSLKFVYLNFKHSVLNFKKLKSIKKNKLKSALKRCARSDYKLVTF